LRVPVSRRLGTAKKETPGAAPGVEVCLGFRLARHFGGRAALPSGREKAAQNSFLAPQARAQRSGAPFPKSGIYVTCLNLRTSLLLLTTVKPT